MTKLLALVIPLCFAVLEALILLALLVPADELLPLSNRKMEQEVTRTRARAAAIVDRLDGSCGMIRRWVGLSGIKSDLEEGRRSRRGPRSRAYFKEADRGGFLEGRRLLCTSLQ